MLDTKADRRMLTAMTTGILLLNFGEPERPDPVEVIAFLEAIFAANFRLEHAADPAAGRRRARELAERRMPALVEDYRRMGGSPLRSQTDTQARAIEIELRRRGLAVVVAVGMQFTAPTLEMAVARLQAEQVERLVAIPLYPLCGPSTTNFALAALQETLRAARWKIEVMEVTGWHRQPAYTELRTRAVREFCERRGLDLHQPDVRLVFSAHGTPMRYLREGHRYDLYVHDHCRMLASALNVEKYALGFQNHENRPDVEWTQPEIADLLQELDAGDLVVVPISFMQELSETLVELDLNLRASAEERGHGFHRVPIPYDDPGFSTVIADVVEKALTTPGACRCRPGAFCLNGDLEYAAVTTSGRG